MARAKREWLDHDTGIIKPSCFNVSMGGEVMISLPVNTHLVLFGTICMVKNRK